MSTEVEVSKLPNCDICQQDGTYTEAKYDGATRMGPWAYMCDIHFRMYGVGLGTGAGQRLIVREK
jgi:hypothetical protein